MKYYNLVYNYGFLADWFAANPIITRKEFLSSLDFSDYNSLKNWIDGHTMMPMTQMLKFCNHYNVPISAFFLDEYGIQGDIFAPITPDSRIEPTGGWPDSSRKAGMKICDPRSDIHIISILPEYVQMSEKATTGSEPSPVFVQGSSSTASTCTATDNITMTERMRYLDIIERLSSDVIRLSNEKAQYWGDRQHGSHSMNIVAEEPK